MEHYPYPPAASARIDPFNAKGREAQFIVFGGSRSTYAFTERVDGRGFYLADWIPMGYKVLLYAQKTAVFRRGAPVKEWPLAVASPVADPSAEASDPLIPRKRRKTRPEASAWVQGSCGYTVAVPSGERTRIGYDAAAAREAAEEASRDGLAAVWFVFDAQDWH